MRTIRSSELGAYLYCRRAWWYQSQGLRPANQAELAAGSAYHQRHAGAVIGSRLMNLAGWVLMLCAIVALVVGLTLWLS